jgi:ADP-ribosylglycohydrolase
MDRKTLQDRAAGVLMGAFSGDALGLGPTGTTKGENEWLSKH